jgi:hypothetical protein
MRGWLPSGRKGLGYPDLDARYDTFTPNPDIARRIVSPEIASLVASRDDWGLSLNWAAMACVTAAPIVIAPGSARRASGHHAACRRHLFDVPNETEPLFRHGR